MPPPEQSKRNEQSKKCKAEVAKAYAAHDFTPPWDLFDAAVSESKKVKLSVTQVQGVIHLQIKVFDYINKTEVPILDFDQTKSGKELIWSYFLSYGAPQG
jgi:hypothetical protein